MADYFTEILPREREAAKKKYYADTSKKLRELEGFIPKTKIPTPGDRPTIGHGHTGAAARPGATMTRPQAQQQLLSDMRVRLPEIIRLTPRFLDLDDETQKAISTAHFRGTWGGSPETRRLFNEGKFSEAATEFLNHDEYRDAVARGRSGIRPRMEYVANALRNARYRKPVDEPAGMVYPPSRHRR